MICNRAVIINRGRIVLEGTVADLTRDRTLEELFVDLVSSDKTEGKEGGAS
jgi:ABC-type multidrug transport system ATPase subunit